MNFIGKMGKKPENHLKWCINFILLFYFCNTLPIYNSFRNFTKTIYIFYHFFHFGGVPEGNLSLITNYFWMYLGYDRTVQDDFESYKETKLIPVSYLLYKVCPLYYKLSMYLNVRDVGVILCISKSEYIWLNV